MYFTSQSLAVFLYCSVRSPVFSFGFISDYGLFIYGWAAVETCFLHMQIKHGNVYHKEILWQLKRGCGNMFLISIVSSTNRIGLLTSPSVDFFFFLPFTFWTRHCSLSKLFDSLTDHDFGRSWQNEYQFQQQPTPPAAFLDRRIFHMQW